MKKTISICLFFVAVVVCSYGGGYYIHMQQQENQMEQEKIVEKSLEKDGVQKEVAESIESAVRIAPYEFILSDEDGYVIVYYADGKKLHSRTDIRVEQLSADLQKEIAEGKEMQDEAELYNFLESYSS